MRSMLLTLFCIVLADEAARAETCPESCLLYDLCSTLAQRDTSTGSECALGSRFASAAYNLPLGHVSLVVYVDGDCGQGSHALARDRFELLGPASPNPITITARLHLVGQVQASAPPYENAMARGSLQEASGTPVEASIEVPYNSTQAHLDTILSLPVTHPVSESFELAYEGWGGAGAKAGTSIARLTGTLSFTDLPPGYGVVSCQGFETGTIVSARGQTWGSLKVSYR